MGTSRDDIRGWLKSGEKQGATHVIVVCDTYDHEDYPHFVMTGEDPRAYKPGEMQRIMEVYALHLDLDSQLDEHRAFHYEAAPAKRSVLSTALMVHTSVVQDQLDRRIEELDSELTSDKPSRKRIEDLRARISELQAVAARMGKS